MDDNQRDLRSVTPSLTAALRRARIEDAERSEVVAELRGAETARLEMLQDALKPVLAQVPEGVDLFDCGLVPGERPRLFIDMIAFVEMGRDRRSYHFFQDTRHGRVTLAETDRLDAILDAVTAYVARRLIEREKALASDGLAPRPATQEPDATTTEAAPSPHARGPQPGAGDSGPFARSIAFLVNALGSLALVALVAGSAYVALVWALTWWTMHAMR